MIAPERRTRIYPVWLPDRPAADQPRTRRRFRLNPMVGAMVLAALLTIPLALFVSQRVQKAEAGYRIRALQSDLTYERAENARLTLRVSELRSPQRIEHYATTKLGMAPPRQRQLAAITAGPTVARVEAPAAPEGFLEQLSVWLGRSEAEARERPR